MGTQLAIEAAAETGAASVLALAGAAPTGGEYGLWSRLVLAGGVALYLAGIAFVDRVNEGSAGDRTIFARLATAAALVTLAALGGPLSPVVFAALVAAGLLALTVLESLRENSTEAWG